MERGKLAVLLQTNLLDRKTLGQYKKLQKAVGGGGDVFFLFDEDGVDRLPNKPSGVRVHGFSMARLRKMGFTLMSETVVPGNSIFAHIHFFEAHPLYDHYWIVEDDVRYAGDWADFFEIFSKYDHDFVTTNLCEYDQQPMFYWWDKVSHPQETIDLEKRMKSFNPCYRMSRRGFAFLAEELRTGWYGHYEVLIATLLHHYSELTMMDMGNDSRFTPPELKNQVYKSYANHEGAGPGSTFQYRPIRFFYGSKRNHLYHPVKRFRPYFIFMLKMVKVWMIRSLR